MASVSKREWVSGGKIKTAWVVRYIDGGGNRRMVTAGSKKEAEKVRLRIELELDQRTHTPDRETMTIAEACERFLSECERRHRDKDRMTMNTLCAFRGVVRNHIAPFIGARKLSRFTAAEAQKWIDDLRNHQNEPRTTWSMRIAVQVLRQTIAEAQRRGYVARNVLVDAAPRIGALQKREWELPPKDKIRKLLAMAQENAANMRRADAVPIGLIVETAMLTGMRVGEILSLQWEYVLFDKKLIRVRHSTDRWRNMNAPKSAAGRRDIPIPPGLAARLAAWKLQRPSKSLVFPTSSGGPLTNANLQRAHWKELRAAAGLGAEGKSPALRFHDLRHIAASLFIESGLPPKRVMYLMGHSSIQITFDRYGHLFPEDDAAHIASAAIEADLALKPASNKKQQNECQVLDFAR